MTSPLQRCHDTATVAAKALGLDVGVDDDLIETDFGGWEGLTFAEAAERDPELHRRWLRDTSTTPPGGKASTRCTSECCGRATGSSPGTPARRCWWCRT
ncbi:histidine phosphatase super family protein [Mycobacterium xenopi 3993]|nr:histidine phosphatase super family protein [Mycobacterium xenopi 3993]